MGMFGQARPLRELLELRQQVRVANKTVVGQAIVSFRREHGITQAQFAQMTGLTQAYLSRVESGAKTPSDETLRKVSKVIEEAERRPSAKSEEGEDDN